MIVGSCSRAVNRISDCDYTTVDYYSGCSDRTGVICKQGIVTICVVTYDVNIYTYGLQLTVLMVR